MSKNSEKQARRKSDPLLRKLEDRILFDAAMDAGMDPNAGDGSQGFANQNESPQSYEEDVATYTDESEQNASADQNGSTNDKDSQVRHELVIVDTSIDDYQMLVNDLLENNDENRDIEVVLLDASADGIEQVSQILSQYNDLDALHLVTHGDDASFRLGNAWVTADNLEVYAGQISGWGEALNSAGDLLMYGCDLAESAEGRELVDSLAALTGTDVAASDNDTGSASRGADWNLEYRSGTLESSVIFSQDLQARYTSVLAVGPDVQIGNANQQVQLGENFDFTVSFDNTGTDVGYGPFIDLIFPVNGADGAAGTETADGIDFVGATYLGQALNTIEIIFPDDGAGTGTIDHPFAVDASGNPLTITGTAGDKLVVLELPFGSFAPNQPIADIVVSATTNNLADLGTDMVIQTRAGFRYGSDPLDNPAIDPSVVSDSGTDVSDPSNVATSWTEQLTVTPTLMSLTKTYLGPENETATGPNHQQQYRIDVDIADGQTISNLDIIDSLPNNIVITSIDSVLVNGVAAAYTDNLGSLSFPGNSLDLIITPNSAVTGTTAAADVSVTFTFYVAEFDADSNRVIPINGEDDTTSTPDSRSFNNARAVGDWTPIDSRDAGGTNNAIADPGPGPEHILDDKAIAIQKSVSIFNDGGATGATPGDTLEYTLQFQISDYYTFGDLIIDDIFQDGQLFDFTYGATFDITDMNGNVAGSFTVRQVTDPDGGETLVVDQTQINYADNGIEDGSTPDGSDGSTTLRFDLSQVLIDNLASDGVLEGGFTNGAANGGAAFGTIRFRTIIQEEFADTFLSGDRSVDHGDAITNNSLTITGTVRENAEDGSINNVLLSAESDASSASISIRGGSLVKDIYAVNGDTNLPIGSSGKVTLTPGDIVTYRLEYVLSTSDFENLRFTDYMPLPIFNVDDANADGITGDTWTFNIGRSFDGIVPVAGSIEFGAGDTFYNSRPGFSDTTDPNFNAPPTITVDASSNGLVLDFGTYDDPTSAEHTIELYISVAAQDVPMADGLFLTNIVRVEEGNTDGGTTTLDQIIQVEVVAPELNITKGVVSSTAQEIQKVFAVDLPANINFSLSFDGQTTTNILNTATSAQVQSALESLSTIGVGSVTVTGGPMVSGGLVDSPYVIEFTGALGDMDVSQITTNRSDVFVETVRNGPVYTGDPNAIVDFQDPAHDPNVDPAFTGTISSDDLANDPLDSDISGLDAGDIVKFAIVLENTGGADAYDITIADLMAAGFEIPANATGLNLEIRDGAGNLLEWSGADTGNDTDLFGGGINIYDPVRVYLSSDTSDELTFMYSRDNFDASNNVTNVGSHGVADIEAMALDRFSGILYGSNANQLGTIDLSNGAFAGIGTTFGTANHSVHGNVNLADVDGMSFNQLTGEFYGVNDHASGNAIFKIDVNTGTFVAGAFGGEDYILVSHSTHIDDIAVDSSGVVYATDATNLLRITLDEAGATSTFTIVGAHSGTISDMEGLSFDRDGRLWGTTGDAGGDGGIDDNSLWKIDLANGTASNQRVLSYGSDYEASETYDPNSRGAINSYNPTDSSNIIIITYDLELADTVQANASYANTATLTNYSGQDGGVDYTTTDPTDSATVSTTNFDATKSIVTTSEAHTTVDSNGVERVTIGEIVRYQIRVAVGEGTFNDLQIRDSLPTGLIFIDDGTSTVAFISDNGNITSTTLTAAGYYSTGNDTNVHTVTPTLAFGVGANDASIANSAIGFSDDYSTSGQDVYFKLGDVVNNDNDANSEFVVIEFNALVDNTTSGSNDGGTPASPGGGDSRYNDVRIYYDADNNGSVNTSTEEFFDLSDTERPHVRVTEPFIENIAKTGDVAEGDGGDVVTYTVSFDVATGDGRADAFDVRIVDSLPSDLSGLTFVEVRVDGVALGSGFTNNTAGDVLDLVIDRVAKGSMVEVEYMATIQGSVSPTDVVTNTANVTWSSLPGVYGTADGSGGNATGSDLLSLDGINTGNMIYDTGSGSNHGERNGDNTGPNDYLGNDTHDVTISATAISKTLDNTSITSGANGANDAVIGEIATYTVTISFNEATMDNARLIDTLDVGLSFIDVTNVTTSGGITYTGDANNPASVSSNGRIVNWDLGTITDTTLGNANGGTDSDGSITITYRAIVTNVISNQQTQTLDNSVSFTWDDDPGTAPNPRENLITSANNDITVVEPTISINKTAAVDFDGDGFDDGTSADAGDQIRYTIALTNTSGIDAFDLGFIDNIPLSGGSSTILSPTFTVTDSAGSVLASDFTLSGSNAAGWSLQSTSNIDFQADATRTITIEITGVLSSNVQPEDVITNSANVTWQNIDGAIAAGDLSSHTTDDTERTGADGTGGALDDYSADNTADITVISPTILKGIISTSINNGTTNTNAHATIGEYVTYFVSVTIPEGVMSSVEILDQLGAGLEFVSLDNIVASANLATDIAVDDFATASNFDPAVVGDGSSATPYQLTFDLGNITNSNNNNAVGETIILTYTVKVMNSVDVDGNGSATGDLLTNAARMEWNSGSSATNVENVSVEVVEAELNVDKQLITAATGDASDTVTYTITISHSTNSDTDAFDATFSDTLPAEIAFGNFEATLSTAGDLDSVFEFDSATNTVRTIAGQSFDLAHGEDVVITITGSLVTANTEPGETITNTADIQWTSLDGADLNDGDDSTERGGDGTGENDYNDSSTNNDLTIAVPTVAKSLAGTSINNANNASDQAVVGETATYEVVLTLSEGTYNSLQLIDMLASGYEFVSVDSIVARSGGVITGDVSTTLGTGDFSDSASFNPTQSAGNHIFNLGTVTNANANNAAVETLTITYTVRVTNTAGNNGNGSGAGTMLGNSAHLEWTADGNNQSSNTAVAVDNVEIIEPQLSIVKTVDDDRPNLGDTVTYTLAINHTAASDTDAYDLVVGDTLPTDLTLDSGSVVVMLGVTTLTAGTDYTITTGSNGFTISGIDLIDDSQQLTVTYDADVTTDISDIGNSYNNTGGLTWTSISGVDANERDGDAGNGGEDDYSDSSIESLTIVQPDLRVTKENGVAAVVPGATYTYDIVVFNDGNDTATGINVQDFLDGNIFDLTTVTTDDPGNVSYSSATGELNWSPGNIAGSTSQTLQVSVTVQSSVDAGIDDVTNNATATHDDIDPTNNNTGTDTDTVNANPILTLTKTDGGITSIAGGGVVYTLTYANTGNQDATGVEIIETLPTGSSFDFSSSTFGWQSIGSGQFRFLIGDLAAGAGSSIDFAVTVDNPLAAGIDQLDNSATIDDDNGNGGIAGIDDTGTDSTPINAAPDLFVTKDDGNDTAGPDSPDNLVIYSISYGNNGSQDATGVYLEETLPPGSTFDSGNSTSGWTETFVGSGIYRLTIGNVASGFSDTATFAVLVDATLPAGQDELNNSITINDDATNGTDETPGDNSDTDDTPVVHAPDLVLTKTDGGDTATADAADNVITYTLTYSNIGSQDATGVVITETLPQYVTIHADSLAAGWSTSDGGVTYTFTVGNVDVGDPPAMVEFKVVVDAALPSGVDTLSNSASIADDGTNGTDETPGDNTGTDDTPVVAAPDLFISKNDNVATGVQFGANVIYTIDYANNGTQTANNVVITETLPTGSSFYPTGSSAGWTTLDGLTYTLNLGTLNVGDSGQVTFGVTANGSIPSGQTGLINNASIADDAANGADEDNTDNTTSDDTVVYSHLNGRVYNDENGNGTFQSGEAGIGGVTVQLFDISSGSPVFVRNTTTAGDGTYSFNNLLAGDYQIREIQPTNYNDGGESDGSLANGDTSTNERIDSIELNAGQSGNEYNFGELGVTLSGNVFIDDNRDGSHDAGETTGIFGVTIELYDATGTNLITSTTTDANGDYSFEDLPADTYVIRQIHPNQYTSTTSNDITAIVPLAGLTNQDFGEALWDLGNFVWFDRNADALQTGEEGLAGVDVILTYAGADGNFATNGDNIVYNTTTDANGLYGFTELFNGEYQVAIDSGDLPSGLSGTFETDDSSAAIDGTSNITVGGSDRFDVDFGYTGGGTIGDFVFFDVDGDGIQDSEDNGLANVTVNVVFAGADGIFGNDDDLTFTTVTDSNGLYNVVNLPGGDFQVSVDTGDTDLPGSILGVSGPQSNNGTANVTLADNGTNNDVDFGFTGTLTLGDRLWFDGNGDGIQDALNEPGFAEVGVTLSFAGQDGIFGNGDDVVLTDTTDANGNYGFTNLADGEYRVTYNSLDLPEGFARTHEVDDSGAAIDGTSNITLNGSSRSEIDFGFRGAGSIGDFVWHDVDGDGVQDTGEPGLANITVDLDFAGDDGVFGTGDDFSLQTATDANGAYSFDNLVDGNYRVDVDTADTDLPGSMTGVSGAESIAGTADVTLDITNGRNPDDVDFGFAGTQSVGDFVWFDADGDGNQDAGEPGFGNVDVTLTYAGQDGIFGNADDVTLNTTTDANGGYNFSQLADGEYRVALDSNDLPTGLSQTAETNDGADTLAETAEFSINGSSRDDIDFGYTGALSIGDTIYYDVNADGDQDAGEPGLVNVDVTLNFAGDDGVFGNADDFQLTTTTIANGAYSFDNLPEGDYEISIDTGDVPSGMNVITEEYDDTGAANDGTATVSLSTAGGNNNDVDFGFTGSQSLGDFVWFDQNGDGVQDAGEPGLGDAQVTLLYAGQDGTFGTTDDVTIQTTTDANGGYNFGNLADGDYQVSVDNGDLPPGMIQTAETDDGTNNILGTAEVAINGADRTDVDFGYQGSGSISDFVWYDADGDGIQDVGEPGLPNALVQLTSAGENGIYGDSDDFALSTATDQNGLYLFDNLPAGEYRIDVTGEPGGMTQTAETDDGTNNIAGVAEIQLGIGENQNDVDFGFVGTGSIGDTVFFDQDGDGVQDPGEVGFPGVAVELQVDFDGDGTFDHTITTTTDSNGNYTFGNLPGSDYIVTVTPPNGTNQTADPDAALDNVSMLALGDGENNTDQNFGYQGTGSISDTVFWDQDADGLHDANEVGLPIVGVQLDVDLDQNGTTDLTLNTTTDANGNYSFNNLPVGDYTTTVTPLAGTVQTFDNDGTLDNVSTVTLGNGQDDDTHDFGYRGTGSIGDVVFLDVAGDGGPHDLLVDRGVPNVDVTLEIDVNGDNVVDYTVTTMTDIDGNYSFDNLIAGNYTITVDDTTVPGEAGTNPVHDNDGGNDHTSDVNLAAGATNNDQDFGYQGNASLGDRVWLDTNGDGIDGGVGSNEPGLANVDVTVTWFGADGSLGTADDESFTTTTDDDGYYQFTSLATGDYEVDVDELTAPSTTNLTTANDQHIVNLSDSENHVDSDFGFEGTGTIGDFVFYDYDGDGAYNPAIDGVYPGVVITLTGDIDGDGVLETFQTTTDANGNYSFPGLPEGNYTVAITPESGTNPTFDATGSQTDGQSTVVLDVANPSNSDQDFGLTGTGTIGDTIFYDIDGDGVQDAGEPGIPGVTVTIDVDLDGDGNPDFTTTAVTDQNGNYTFENIPEGDHTVTVTTPDGSVATTDHDGTPGGDNSSDVNLPAGTTNEDQDFGFDGTGSIGDTVFWDQDADGTHDANEVGLPGVIVELDIDFNSDGTVDHTLTTTTDANGQYSFGDLPAGQYTVRITQPAGTTQTYDADGITGVSANQSVHDLTAGEDNFEQDFGYRGNGSIGDIVFFDYSGDGGPIDLADNDRGMSGVDVTLEIDVDGDGTVDVTRVQTTDTNGNYNFGNLIEGDYTITVDSGDLPDAMGANPTYNSDGTIDNTTDVVLAADEVNDDVDFGYHATPDYTITKDDGFSDIVPGQTITYTITLTNNGTYRGQNVIVTDTFPTSILENVSATLNGVADGIVDMGAGTVTWNLPIVGMGETVTMTVTADVINPLATGITSLTNNVGVADDGFNGVDPTASNNSDDDVNIVTAQPDYQIIKSNDLTRAAIPGQTFNYFLQVFNNGNQDGTGVVVSDTLPISILDGFSVLTDDPTNITYNPFTGDLVWNAGAIGGGGGTRTLMVTVTVQDPVGVLVTSFDNSAAVTDDGNNGADPNLTDNTSTNSAGLDATPDYEIVKASSLTDTTMVGDSFEYTITVRNLGSQDGTGVVVTDTMPVTILDRFNVTTSDPSNVSYDSATGELIWNVGDLNGRGDAATLTIQVTIPFTIEDPLANVIINTATVTDDGLNGPDLNQTNNSSTVEDDVLVFAFDSFNNFTNSFGRNESSVFGVERGDDARMLKPIPVDPIFSGLAEPGTTLNLKIYDEEGNIVGERQVMADAGGNWVANFPNAVIWKHPHRMDVEQTAPIQSDVNRLDGFNMRRYFHPATHASLFFTERDTVQSVERNSAYETINSMHHANNEPLQVGWRSHLYQLNVSSTNASSK